MHAQMEVIADIDDEHIREKPKGWFVILVTLLSTIGAFLFGYDTGIISGAMIFVTDRFKLDSLWHELIVSITIIGAWIFSLLAGFMADSIGRKPVILISSIIFVVGSLILGLAWTKVHLLVGRLVVGAAVGLSSTIVPMYNAEIAPKSIRGRLVGLNQNFICFGQFIAAVVAGGLSYNTLNGWRYMLGLAAVPALIQFFGFFAMPESPRFLVKKNMEDKALVVLKKTQPTCLRVEKELDDIRKTCAEQSKYSQKSFSVFLRIFKTKSVRNALLVGCALQMFQQIVGINTVMYYTATIIEISGVTDKSTAIWYSALVALVPFVCNFGSFFFIEKFGRRKTCLWSLVGVVISLLIIGIGFQIIDSNNKSVHWRTDSQMSHCLTTAGCSQCLSTENCGFCYQTEGNTVLAACVHGDSIRNETDYNFANATCVYGSQAQCPRLENPGYSYIVVGGLITYLVCFALGIGPVPWIMNTELYPLWARSLCIATATSMNWLFNLTISMTFLTLTEVITKPGTFYLYGAFGVVGFLLFYKVLPETKDNSLEESISI